MLNLIEIPWPHTKEFPRPGDELDAGELGQVTVWETGKNCDIIENQSGVTIATIDTGNWIRVTFNLLTSRCDFDQK